MSLLQIFRAANPTPYHKKLNRGFQEDLSRDFSNWCRAHKLDSANPAEVCRFVRDKIDRELDRLWLLEKTHREFQQSFPLITSPAERLEAIIEQARLLGADGQQLEGDRIAAKKRWFGPEALNDRFRRRKLKCQHRLIRLSEIWSLSLKKIAVEEESDRLWETCGGILPLERLESDSLDPRVQQAALTALATGLSEIPVATRHRFLDAGAMGVIRNWSIDSKRDVWVQAEAQRLLGAVFPDELAALLRRSLENPLPGDDFFVRARLIHRLAGLDRLGHSCWDVLPTVKRDPSEFVRQEASAVLSAESARLGFPWLRQFALEDRSPRVRAAALASLRNTVGRKDWRNAPIVDLLAEVLANETDQFVLRTAARIAGDWLTGVMNVLSPEPGKADPPELAAYCHQVQNQIMPQINKLRGNDKRDPLRRQLALESERLWSLTTPRVRHCLEKIRTTWNEVAPGKSKRFPREYMEELGNDLGRGLAVLAQKDFGYHLERGLRGWRLRRGERTGFRIWRMLHELRTPTPDKRQAHKHTLGRFSRAEIHAPSAILSELSETKVPGEPVYSSHEASWKPFLPLLDDVLSAVTGFRRHRSVRFYSSEGVTTLTPPRSIFKRWLAAFTITLRFSQLAALRNWRHDSQHQPNEYAEALRRLGFEISFAPYGNENEKQNAVEDASVTRYFSPAPIGLLALSDKLDGFLNDLVGYFYSPYQNTSWHLLLFLVGIGAIFLGRHFYVNWKFRKQRQQIPLSIGGWGTRGKSGTERLKAALFCSQGYNVVSKSTGCEAMFMLAPRMGRLTEMFLFRPYDKASIWEQLDVMEIAKAWDADVFLWECMGLSPTYVEVLQQQWMQDDIATITNTYPDHEDIQGPTGTDVARSIAGFVPSRSNTITTEREMLPLLEEAARTRRSRLESVGWMEAGLLADDVIERFPYQEHPENIALVQRLAAKLNIPRDVALKAMADDLVADLGVLKTFPPAVIQTRTIEFTNGMSANERLGCLANWNRLGFDRHDTLAEPGLFVTTVVNNRADRVARSRVFAELIVNDLNADRHILIGNNLKGMLGYIAKAWDRLVEDLQLWSHDETGKELPPEQTLKSLLTRHRWPTEEKAVKDRLAVMFAALLPGSEQASTRKFLLDDWRDPAALSQRLEPMELDQDLLAAVLSHHRKFLKAFSAYEEFAECVRNAQPDERLELTRRLHELLRPWIDQKLVVVDDYHASGDEVIRHVVDATPPGFRNRVMGIQNIKGTGLDFIYRFQSWEECDSLCRQLISEDQTTAAAAIKELAEVTEFGLLGRHRVLKAIETVESRPQFHEPELRSELTRLRNRIEDESASRSEDTSGHRPQSGWKQAVWNWAEQFLDLGDAVWRRKQAEQVYRDIVAERISLDQAAAILRDLTKRQKGGWLAARLSRKPTYKR